MRLLILLGLLLFSAAGYSQKVSTAKPWTYWWWMGSAVKTADIQQQLKTFQQSGLGGVHIIPIYGAKGAEKDFLTFLSKDWMDALEYTVEEGSKLGLGVDMTTGTGWPFGGPNVSAADGAKQLDWANAASDIKNTNQMVKRAAPGGEGLVLDPFDKDAMKKYLTRFDSAFNKIEHKPRSMYMDSYEAYGANWTSDFFNEFKKRKGYDLHDNLILLRDSSDNAKATLVRIDYHQTLAELLRERYAYTWTQWSREKGFLTRYQAHGSPGNLLDLYEEADIPETESFGSSRFPIPGLRVDPDYSIKQFGTPNPLAMKLASSPAHLTGKKLVSSETGTWLANHFKVSLSQIKPQIDELFLGGINHVFYHGTTYSPVADPYPGWLFYASTNFGPTSHFAPHLKYLNQYVERCQSILQESTSDNDILVYFPIHDLWSKPSKSSGGVHLLEVHHVDRWLLDLPFGKLSQKLWNEGYSFDFVSDRQLTQLKADGKGNVVSKATTYKTILVPSVRYMPKETMEVLSKLAKNGVRIVFDQKLPERVTGFYKNETTQREFKTLTTGLSKMKNIQVGDGLQKMLAKNGVVQEELSGKGLTYLRKKTNDGKAFYFVSNLANTFNESWIHLGKIGKVTRFDPLTNTYTDLPSRIQAGKEEVYLKLLPGQSCFLQSSKGAEVIEKVLVQQQFELNGNWTLEFLKGRPTSPEPVKMDRLISWTETSDSAVYFSGTAKYSLQFDAPQSVLNKESLQLDLGQVCEIADVKLNGVSLGTLWSIPFVMDFKSSLLKETGNILEVEVTNLSANYMRLRDKQSPDWKKFYDINMADITYKKFDASSWKPMPSGLLGPVKILYSK